MQPSARCPAGERRLHVGGSCDAPASTCRPPCPELGRGDHCFSFPVSEPTQYRVVRVRMKSRPLLIAGVAMHDSPMSFFASTLNLGPASSTTITPFSPVT